MQRPRGRHNSWFGFGRESAGFVVAWKRSNVRGAKGPCQVRARVRERQVRLDTEDPMLDAEGPITETRPMPPTLSLLRHKLSQKGECGRHYGDAADAADTLSFETQAEPKGQARAEVSILRSVRSNLSVGHAVDSVASRSTEHGCSGCGRRDDPTDRHAVHTRC